MPRPCSTCSHEKREAIDAALVKGASNRRIATQFSLSEASVRRHVQGQHVEAKIAQAAEAAEVASADGLLDDVRGLRSKAISLLLAAEGAGELRTAIAGVREVRGVLELLGRLVGELEQQTVVNVLIQPAYLNLRTAALDVLAGHPEQLTAFASRLREIEAGADG